MASPNQYDPSKIADKWYDYWLKNGYFKSTPNEKEPYTIVIPPPNVTGVLHMGHMLNNTLQDVLIRRARLRGYNACWVPGTDHASIATEAKVVAQLKSKGIEKSQLTREEFLKHAWDWTEKYGGVILEQLKKLGASCDWDRTAFTLDPRLSESVQHIFIDLYEKGLIYRGYRMVNWDPEAKTTLSDEEVIFEERQGNLYHIKYAIVGEKDAYVTVATTRPETLLGDTAICINPSDERFKKLRGKKVILPIANREIPVIEDDYVDIEFGTGCLKITPAHDPNDNEIGKRHNLEVIDIFNDDATLNEKGLHYAGQDRFIVRKAIVKELNALGLLEKTTPHTNKIGTSERTGAVIEPKISAQWFLKMDSIVQPALKAVLKDESISFFPDHYKNTYRHWLENIRDWNISRQLWWGHQIPAYYFGKGVTDFVVAKNATDALEKARKKSGHQQLQANDLKQDADCLDTWFSSWLWPMAVFDGVLTPENKEFKYYYPTNDLVTGPDILFFWVARMIFAGYEFTCKKPFNNVYFTGIVRDSQRRKMSKSLGNSPDPLKLIEKYGADGVRVGLLLSASAGNDLLFDEKQCVQGRNFVTKIYNGFKLIKSWQVCENTPTTTAQKMALGWYESRFHQTFSRIEKSFDQYRISDALMILYKLIWEDFSAWFLELMKPEFGKLISVQAYDKVIDFLEKNLKLLHPFIPFVTEDIWQSIKKRTAQEALIIAKYPSKKNDFDTQKINDFELVKEVITALRKIRKDNQIPFKNQLSLFVIEKEKVTNDYKEVIQKMANISDFQIINTPKEGVLHFNVRTNAYFVPFENTKKRDQKKKELEEELAYTEGFLQKVQQKLSNERFVANAPEKVVAMERKKEADATQKIQNLKTTLSNL